jgi:hypothetical protein
LPESCERQINRPAASKQPRVCSAADLVADNITYSHFKSWTTTAAQKILAYLQQAPGGRSLLCPPRFYWGATYQIFHRSPDVGAPFFGVHNWWGDPACITFNRAVLPKTATAFNHSVL